MFFNAQYTKTQSNVTIINKRKIYASQISFDLVPLNLTFQIVKFRYNQIN